MSDGAATRGPTVSVVIPVYDDTARLLTCLDALDAQTYPDLLEVVVVDNDSTEDVAAAVGERPRVHVVTEGRRGSYAARNTGAALTRGDVIAFTDSDCVPRPDWLATAVSCLVGDASVDAVGGDIALRFRNGTSPTTGPELFEWLHTFQQRRYIETWHFAATANLVVRAEAFRRVGPFDAARRSGGDLDWGQRLAAAGGRLVHCPAAVVEHPSRPGWHDLRVKAARVATGLADHEGGGGVVPQLRAAQRDARAGVSIWWRVWSAPEPRRGGDKLRYAAAFSYVRWLRALLRTGRVLTAGLSSRG